jgi:hypothetical protein
MNDGLLEPWKEIRDAAEADAAWTETQRQLVARRGEVRKELLAFTHRFLEGGIDAEELRATFDSRTRVEWAGFGLKGMSYAMFLNKLLKYLGDDPSLASRLRETLTLPRDRRDGYNRLRAFHEWLNARINAGTITRKSVQPARAPSFVSAFWHMQDPEAWPIYYESARFAFARLKLIDPPDDVVDAYFQFREVFLELGRELGVSSWTLEQLSHRPVGTEPPAAVPLTPPAPDLPAASEVPETRESSGHAHAQWMLAHLGRKLGCQVWIATNDRSKRVDGQPLSTVSLETLPRLGLADEVTRRLSYVDVLWLKGSKVVAAFEVEHTTSIYSGLLRLSDLVAAAPNLNFRLYIVTPEARMRSVEAELRRPTFQTLELHKRCGFFAEETLLREMESIVRWATEPEAIDRLATYVDDVDED